MIGYSRQSKGYKSWDPESSCLIVSRDATFNENSVNSLEIPLSTSNCTGSDVTVPGGEIKEEVDDNIDLEETIPVETNPDPADITGRSTTSIDDEETENVFQDAQDAPELPRSSRVRKQTGEWWKATGLPSLAVPSHNVHKSYKTATTHENIGFWQPGIDREHECLMKNQTWSLVDYEPGMKVLPGKYDFKIKETKAKVRLVALGCLQLPGIGCNEAFAPVVTIVTIRLILAIAAAFDPEIEQMDVVTAFLNGDLNEDIYMAILEGLKNSSMLKKYVTC